MIQIVLGCILVLLGIVSFIKYPMKQEIKSLAFSALFIVLTLILKRIAIMVPLFGFESLKIGFEMIPLMLAGMMLTPSYCFLIGMAVDLIGLMIVPTGFPFFGFTLNSVLTAMIPSVICQCFKQKHQSLLRWMIPSCFGILAIASTIYILSLDSIVVSNHVMELTKLHKAGMIGLSIIVICGLLVIMRLLEKKFSETDMLFFYRWVLSCIIVELCVVMILTPMWLDIMYGIPFMLSLLVRIIKSTIMIPLNIIIGYSVYRVLKQI